jgi:hypothetical protein
MSDLPPIDPGTFEKLRQLVADSIDVAVVSLLSVIGVQLALPGLQRRLAYGGSALIFGLLLGVAARWSPLPDGFEIVGTILGVITGPVTVAKMEGKTLGQAIEDLARSRRRALGDEETPEDAPGGDDDA